MFKKLGKALSSKNRTKVRLDVQISAVQGLPASVAACRVVWARDAKVQMTTFTPVQDGSASWDQELGIIATMNKDSKGKYESKLYDFRIQAPDSQQRFITLGKASLDMANYMTAQNEIVTLPIIISGIQVSLTVIITVTSVKGISDDALSELSSVSGTFEQDLNGFDYVPSPAPTTAKRMVTATEDKDVDESVNTGTVVVPKLALGTSNNNDNNNSPPPPPIAAAGAVIGQHDDDMHDADTSNRKEHTDPTHTSVDPGDDAASTTVTSPHQNTTASDKNTNNNNNNDYNKEVEDDEEEYYDDNNEEYTEGLEEQPQEEEEDYYGDLDYQELEDRLYEAETRWGEAEELAQEAMDDLEKERAARREAEALATQIQRDLEFANRKIAKERSDWESRMKDSFQKMEGTVLLTERVQKEKAELADRLAALAVEKRSLEEMLDISSVEKKVEAAAVSARETAEAQAAIEIDALKKRLEEMEAFVDEADAKALMAASKFSQLQAQLLSSASGGMVVGGGDGAMMDGMALHSGVLDGGSHKDGGSSSQNDGVNTAAATAAGMMMTADGWRHVRVAEERADALSLELQYAKSEIRTLEEEVKAARADADRAIAAARREAEGHAARAADFARQLEQARAASASAERSSSQAQSRVLLLEDAVERSNLQAAELRQRIAIAQAANSNNNSTKDGDKQQQGGGGEEEEAASGISPELRIAMQQVREVQDAAEARAAQLAATSRDLVAAQEAATSLQIDLHALQQELIDAQRMVSLRDDEIHSLKAEVTAKQKTCEALQHAAKMQTKGGDGFGGIIMPSASPSPSPLPFLASPARHQLPLVPSEGATNQGSDADQAVYTKRLGDAQELARSSAQQTAELIQQLAHSQNEKAEANAKITEMRGDLARLRSGSDGELRIRIEALERDLMVARNRADVNGLFRQEHDRIANELITTKLAWAEAQEQLVMLKRSLIKSQERSMSFASKVTSLETKLYRSFTNVTSDLRSVVRRRKEGKKGGVDGGGVTPGAPLGAGMKKQQGGAEPSPRKLTPRRRTKTSAT